MKYTTTDELEHFSFAEAYIADVQVTVMGSHRMTAL